MVRPRLKICCISSHEEAALAVALGADILGFVAVQPSGPGIIEDALIRDIATKVPPGVTTFLLTSREQAADIADHVAFCKTDCVQIVRHISIREHEKLNALLPPSVKRIQVIHVEDRTALALIAPYTPYVDAFLLDSGKPNAAVAELGATGRTHDWAISAEFVQQSAKPVFLAGGLKAGNVQEAIRQVRPWGLDLCSGVRSKSRLGLDKGHLDRTKLAAFVKAAISDPG